MAAEVIGQMPDDSDLLQALTEAWAALGLYLLRRGDCHRASCAAWVAEVLSEAIEAQEVVRRDEP
jgi:hypothetical protein